MPPSTVFSFIPIHEPFLPNFGLVEHSLSGTVFFGPVEVPLIEIQLYDYQNQQQNNKGLYFGKFVLSWRSTRCIKTLKNRWYDLLMMSETKANGNCPTFVLIRNKQVQFFTQLPNWRRVIRESWQKIRSQ